HMFTSTYLASQDLEVESADIEVDAPKGVKYVKVQPGKSAEIKFTPMQNGTFEFSCDVKSGGRSHRDRGMKGQLVVNLREPALKVLEALVRSACGLGFLGVAGLLWLGLDTPQAQAVEYPPQIVIMWERC